MRLEDKVAIVTGGASGIGCATAERFAQEGAKVVIADVDATHGPEAAQGITRSGGEATFVRCDVSKAADVETLIRTTVETYGKLDILFNNAGNHIPKTVDETSEEEWDGLMTLNLKGVFLGCKIALPELRKTRRHHRQHRVDGRPGGPAQRRRLLCHQRWGDRHDPSPRARSGARGHPRQLCVPRRRRDAADGTLDSAATRSRRIPPRHGRHAPAGLDVHTRGDRGNRPLPGLRRRILHHWPGASGRGRLDTGIPKLTVDADLAGKVALVTGSSRGLGPVLARRLAQACCDLALNYNLSREPAEALTAEIRGMGRRVEVYHANVSQSCQVRRMVQRTAADLGGADILINNAGPWAVTPLREMDEPDWKRPWSPISPWTSCCIR